jgi:hypothetical protein
MPMVNPEMNAADPTVETLLDQISELTAERQRLREQGINGSKLEQNRVELAGKQWELSHALIARYRPSVAQAV